MILIKLGSAENRLSFQGRFMDFHFSYISLLGMVLYIVSFILWMIALQKFQASYIIPIAVGLSLCVTVLLSLIILKESIGLYQGVGMFLIIAGVVLMNIKK